MSHSKASITTASDGEPPVREARSVGEQVVVQPVDCVLSEWSAWSRCDTCQKKRVSMMPDACACCPIRTLQYFPDDFVIKKESINICVLPRSYKCCQKHGKGLTIYYKLLYNQT